MNISEKIEEIRQQPENVRMKYVWGCVAASMIVIFGFWIFSIASMLGQEKNNSNQETVDSLGDIKQQLLELKKQAPSINDITGSTAAVEVEGVQGAQNMNTPTPTDTNINPEVPQSDTYSNLPNTDTNQ